jgi:hypothetical protein
MSTYPQRQPRRILVVANETVESPAILEALLESHGGGGEASEVMVLVPALNTRLRYWMSDIDHARLAAQWRLIRSLDALRDAGVVAEGCIGDADPFLAIGDILAVFPADEILIATHPERRSNWLARDLPAHARAAFPQPVRHIVVENAADVLVPVAA